jgi:hypothetical protein
MVPLKQTHCEPKKTVMKLLLSLLLFVAAASANAATHYIRDGGTASPAGTGSCTGWATANACDQLPSTLVRGDTYCVADGVYNSRDLTTSDSGTATITIKKAVQGDGTCDQGTNWVSSYGDGQAVFNGQWNVKTRYWVIDGARRNDSNWGDDASYGFRLFGGFRAAPGDGGHPGPGCSADNVTVRYVAMGAAAAGESNADTDGGFYFASFAGPGPSSCENWTIDRIYLFNVVNPFNCAGCNGFLIQYSRFGETWGKEAIRGQHSFSSHVIRYNEFVNSCQGREACTAEIAAWAFTGSGLYDNNQIYGNVFYKSTGAQNTGGIIIIGGDGGSWVGSPGNNNVVYNNTFVGFNYSGSGAHQTSILLHGGSGNVCRNNLWFDSTATPGAKCNTSSNNVEVTSSPFVSYNRGSWSASNLRLAAPTQAGTALGGAYSVDAKGVTRGADGAWDLGAYEYQSGGGAPAPTALVPPSNLTAR